MSAAEIARTREHASQKQACGYRWEARAPYAPTDAQPIRHVCKAHVIETGECLCPCGARAKKEQAKS